MQQPAHDRESTASLRALLSDRVCIVGVGNRMRGDDGAGPALIDARRPGTRGVWIDAGVAPENFLETIAKTDPDVVLMVDAVAFGGLPGDYRLMDSNELDRAAVSTHAGSLCMLSHYLSARSVASLRVLAIQPESIAAREGLSPAVEECCLHLAGMLSELLGPATEVGE